MISRLHLKVETLWDFQLHRGHSKRSRRGLRRGTPRSPCEEFLEHAEELVEPLRIFYRKLGRTVTNAELTCQIELHFGDEIVEKICIPAGLNQGACMVIAIALATGDPVVDLL